LGQGLYFEEGEGPKFRKVIRTAADVENLPEVNIASELEYVMNAVSVIRKELNGSVPLIGFSGSPWTLATYMIEGGGSKDFRHAKQFMYDNPEAMHLLLNKLADAVTDYLNAQIDAGAQVVQIFDTWGGILTPSCYQEFSLAYMKKIIANLTKERQGRKVPSIVFTKNGGQWLESIVASGADGVGLDWTIDIAEARRRAEGTVALQGNMDPTMLYASPAAIRKEVDKILAGYGITPQVNPDHVSVFVDSVHELSGQYHR
jgi:uroporphyrinogen decarboxylase